MPLIALLPIFINKDADALWFSRKGKKLIGKILGAMTDSISLDKHYVFTNNDTIKNLAEAARIESRFLDIAPFRQNATLLPIGAREAVEQLDSTDEDIFILNFRNPLIQPDLIDNAANQFRSSKVPILFSIASPVDHPCQLKAYYNVLGMGLVHLFESESESGAYLEKLGRCPLLQTFYEQNGDSRVRLTKPFYFDWKGRGITGIEPPGLFAPYSNGLHIRYIPFENCIGNRKTPCCLYIRHSCDEARVLFSMNAFHIGPDVSHGHHFPASISGASAPVASIPSAVLLRDPNDPEMVRFHFTMGEHPSSALVRIRPVTGSGVQPREIAAVCDQGVSDPMPGVLCDENTALIYSLLQTSEDGSCDLEECFQPPKALWALDETSGKTINLGTGNEINGRQDFPEVFEPDGSFIILKKNAIQNIEHAIAEGHAGGFLMDRTDSVNICSYFDLLRYEAVIRAKAESRSDHA